MKETADKSDNSNEVVVTDIKMSFGSMVVFMVKWVLASIPAFIILCLILVAWVFLLGIVFGGDLFENFLSFVYLFLNNDKYKGISLDILNYILSEKDMVMMKLSQK